MKEHLGGKQGILVFRITGAGAHTELWDGKSIIQKAGAPGGMKEQYIFRGRLECVFSLTPVPSAHAIVRVLAIG
jgi:hypothetical protein